MEGLGTLTVDTAYGGDSFVIVDATALGFEIVPDEACDLVETGMKITAAANEQFGFQHPVECRVESLVVLPVCRPAGEGQRRAGRAERGGHPPRQDRPIAHGHGMFGANGGPACAGTNAGRGSVSSAVDHWIRVRVRDRLGDFGWRDESDRADRFRSCVDYGNASAHA